MRPPIFKESDRGGLAENGLNEQVIQMTKRVTAVVGSRTTGKDELDRVGTLVQELVNKHKNNTIWMSGGCASGADFWVRKLCRDMELRYIEAPAFWSSMFGSNNKYAGPYRNQTIAMVCDEAYAFWDMKSPGTKSFIEAMEKLGKPCHIINMANHPLDKMDKPKRPPGQ